MFKCSLLDKMALQSNHLSKTLAAACDDSPLSNHPSALGLGLGHIAGGRPDPQTENTVKSKKRDAMGRNASATDGGGGFGSTLGSVSDGLHLLGSSAGPEHLIVAPTHKASSPKNISPRQYVPGNDDAS